MLTDSNWANAQLRFAIRLLKGQICSQSFERAINDAISIKKRLHDAGYWWQANRIDNWIHRAQQNSNFIVGKDSTSLQGGALRSPDQCQEAGEGS